MFSLPPPQTSPSKPRSRPMLPVQSLPQWALAHIASASWHAFLHTAITYYLIYFYLFYLSGSLSHKRNVGLCHDMYVESREQSARVNLLLLPCGFQGQNSGHLNRECLYLLSCFTIQHLPSNYHWPHTHFNPRYIRNSNMYYLFSELWSEMFPGKYRFPQSSLDPTTSEQPCFQ